MESIRHTKRHRNQSDILEIGYQVKNSDQNPEDYRKRYAYYGEAYAIEHSRTQSYQRLTAEVAVHAVLYVVAHFIGHAAVAFRHEHPETRHE